MKPCNTDSQRETASCYRITGPVTFALGLRVFTFPIPGKRSIQIQYVDFAPKQINFISLDFCMLDRKLRQDYFMKCQETKVLILFCRNVYQYKPFNYAFGIVLNHHPLIR